MNKVFIALGSNIAPRLGYLTQAIERLQQEPSINHIKKSAVYETEPVGLVDQDRFLNMVVELETNLEPEELLNTCQNIERILGRKREVRWGPRTVDLDILLYNQEQMATDRLTVPHPRLQERAFVLVPLVELCPSLYIRGLGQTASQLLTTLPLQDREGVIKCQPIERVDESKPFEN